MTRSTWTAPSSTSRPSSKRPDTTDSANRPAGRSSTSPPGQASAGGPPFLPLLRFRLTALRLGWFRFPSEAAASRRIIASIRRALGKGGTDQAERLRLARAALLYRRMARLLPLPPACIEGDRRPLDGNSLLIAPAGWFDGELRRWLGPGTRLTILPPPCLGPAANPAEPVDSLPEGTRMIRYVRMGVSRGRVEWGPELPEDPEARARAVARWLDGVFTDNPALHRWMDE